MTWAELDQAVRARGLQDLDVGLLYVISETEEDRALASVEIFPNANQDLTVLNVGRPDAR